MSFLSNVFWHAQRHPVIKKHVKKRKEVIHGGRALNAQIGFLSRPSQDYDVFSKKPKQSAKKLKKKLGSNYYYKPSEYHKGTHKVVWVGKDGARETRDDTGVADFTQTPRTQLKTVNIGGVRYVHYSEIVKSKKKALASKEFEFRHAKDKDDIRRVKTYKKLWR